MFGSKDLLFSSETYGVAKSLRFRGGQYLNRTPSTTSGSSSQIYTWSGWVKLGYFNVGFLQAASGNSGNRMTSWYLRGLGGSGALEFEHFDGTTTYNLTTSAVFRDPSAWYHIVIAVDTPQATNTNRTKIYVNGVQQTVTGTYVLVSTNTYVNNATIQAIGSRNNANAGYGSYFDGYLAEVNFIDGQALTPTSFGFYDNNGIWQPKGYTGTYGTNGFYLKFTDVGATSGSNTGYGKDFSGFNTNYWTTNNFGTTSNLTTYDSMLDSPTNAAGDIGNFPTISAVNYNSTYITLSEANLRQTYAGVTAAAASQATMAIPTTGKWYFEVYINATGGGSGERVRVGICAPTDSVSGNTIDNSANHYMQMSNGQKRTGTTDSTYGASFSAGQIIQVLFDATAGSIYFGQNDSFANGSGSFNQTFATATAAFTSISGQFIPAFVTYGGADISVNFGQRPFSYTPPSGFSALNTQNLTTPTIANGASYMAAVTWTGDQTNPRSIVASSSNSGNNPLGTTFAPGLAWLKSRSNAYAHTLWDVVRGAGAAYTLNTDGTNAESNNNNATYGYLSAFNSDGFTVVPGTGGSGAAPNGYAYVNQNSTTYVAWEWQAGGAPTTDNVAGAGNVPTAGSVKINGANSSATLAGSIAATRISANTSSGFSVVTYTTQSSGTGTVGHGLGAAPSFVICKNRAVAGDWSVYHSSVGSGAYLFLNSTAASTTNSTWWNNTAPSSTVFTLGSAFAGSFSQVAYCFAPVAGYSAFGSYTGNSSADGPFNYTGFRIRYLLIKNITTGTTDWYVFDSTRNPYNVTSTFLNPNLSSAESTGGDLDILSNGFKLRASATATNLSANTYIYAAFAEVPFKIARSR